MAAKCFDLISKELREDGFAAVAASQRQHYDGRFRPRAVFYVGKGKVYQSVAMSKALQ